MIHVSNRMLPGLWCVMFVHLYILLNLYALGVFYMAFAPNVGPKDLYCSVVVLLYQAEHQKCEVCCSTLSHGGHDPRTYSGKVQE